jgi:CRISPR type IV-associated protein Csf1
MCGGATLQGEPVMPLSWQMTESFNNKLDCKTPGGVVCGHCAALSVAPWTQAWSKAYAIEGEGVFWLVRGEDQAAFVLGPPTADYVACINTKQQGHVIWRTPVARPSNWLQVRIDDQVVLIDRKRAIEGARALQAGYEILKAIGQPKATLALFGNQLASISAGVIVEKYAEMIEGQGANGAEVIAALRSLTLGEWWAVAALRHFDMDDPVSWPVRRPIPVHGA